MEPGHPAIPNNVGPAEREPGRLDAAEEALGRALDIEPTNPAALKNLAQLKRRRGDYPAAFAALDRLDDTAESLQARAEMHYFHGDTAEAVTLV
ncbi:tetratricopeptide repeat protein, partial [Mycobacterium tuberculosis]|nr:tetratricopeptide repeat protein [Mycobacterium tuberculosis]